MIPKFGQWHCYVVTGQLAIGNLVLGFADSGLGNAISNSRIIMGIQ
jgi:hypothetical protein